MAKSTEAQESEAEIQAEIDKLTEEIAKICAETPRKGVGLATRLRQDLQHEQFGGRWQPRTLLPSMLQNFWGKPGSALLPCISKPGEPQAVPPDMVFLGGDECPSLIDFTRWAIRVAAIETDDSLPKENEEKRDALEKALRHLRFVGPPAEESIAAVEELICRYDIGSVWKERTPGSELPWESDLVIWLRDERGLSYREISELLSRSEVRIEYPPPPPKSFSVERLARLYQRHKRLK